MSDDKCPKCGMPASKIEGVYQCGSSNKPLAYDGYKCLRRQLAAANADNERLNGIGTFVIEYTTSLRQSAADLIDAGSSRELLADTLIEFLTGIISQTQRHIKAALAAKKTVHA